MRFIRRHLSSIILVTILLAGLSLLLYPTVADYWNSFHQSRAIAGYAEQVAGMDEHKYERMLAEAYAYNEDWKKLENHWFLDEEQLKRYNSVLDITGTGIMGYVEIPSIKVSLPIYHGVDEGILQVAIGHLDGTSLPVGGEGLHAVISGHRGLPSAKLFTDLDKLVEGDIFIIRVLNEMYTYQVDQILIVLPEDTTALEPEDGKDYCTLVTCTPYGVNSHRMLVRGHRIENLDESEMVLVVADAQQFEPVLVAPVVAAPMLLVLFIGMMVRTGIRKRKKKKAQKAAQQQ